MKRYILTFVAMACCCNVFVGQSNKLQIGAEIRLRSLFDNGYKTPQLAADNTLVYTTQRTRLNTWFETNGLQSYISIQDVRVWGDDNIYKISGNYGNTASTCLHQAWVKLKINKPLTLKIGRQVFSNDDQRVMSARNWNDFQVTYDAVLFEFKKQKQRVHLGMSYNAENKSDIYYPTEKFKTFDFVHYRLKADRITISGVAIVVGNTLSDTTAKVVYRATYGANVNYKTPNTNARLSAYYQHNLNDIGSKVSAFCLSASVGHQLFSKLKVGLGYDYLSGNDGASSSLSNKHFDILYGQRHGKYGYMDYFSTTPQQGLQDAMAKLTYLQNKKITVCLHFHYFLLAGDWYGNSSGVSGKDLGRELDLKMKYKFRETVAVECGCSLYASTSTLEELKQVQGEGLKTPWYCYLMLTVKPSVFLDRKNID